MTNVRALHPEPRVAAVPAAAAGELSDRDLLNTWHALRHAANAVELRLHAALLAVPLPAQSVEALAGLARVPNRRLTMSRLATSLGLTSGGLTKLVDRLVQDGLVTRQYSEQDRRVIFAVLTDAGSELSERAVPVYAAQLQAEFGRLGSTELDELRSALRSLAGNPAGRRG